MAQHAFNGIAAIGANDPDRPEIVVRGVSTGFSAARTAIHLIRSRRAEPA